MSRTTISSLDFYNTYHGHKYDHLQIVFNGLKKSSNKKTVFLAGDSSLDNKFWLKDFSCLAPAINDYENCLTPPTMKTDVSYHLNKLFCHANLPYHIINCAIEESTITERQDNLLPQDTFIRDNIQPNDILIVSIGGNDIALRPSFSTIWNIFLLTTFNSIATIKKGPSYATGMSYFIEMFKHKVKRYILKLIGSVRPKKILICMIYFPDEHTTGSWADTTLGYLGYNSNPTKLQEIIRQIFIHATSEITIEGSQVIPVPLYEVMDGKISSDYVERVEPSSTGGQKMANKFIDLIM